MAVAATLVAVAALQRCWRWWGRGEAAAWTGRTVERGEAMPTVKRGAGGSRSNSKQRGGGRGAASRASAVSRDAHPHAACKSSQETQGYAGAVEVIPVHCSGKSEESFACASDTNTSDVLIPLPDEVISSPTPEIETFKAQSVSNGETVPIDHAASLTEEQDTKQSLYSSSVLPAADGSVNGFGVSSADVINIPTGGNSEQLKDLTTINDLNECKEVKNAVNILPVGNLTTPVLEEPSTTITSLLESDEAQQSLGVSQDESVTEIVFAESSLPSDNHSTAISVSESQQIQPSEVLTINGTTNIPSTSLDDLEETSLSKDISTLQKFEETPITWVATVTMSRSVSRDFVENGSEYDNYATQPSSGLIPIAMPVDNVEKIESAPLESSETVSSKMAINEPEHITISNEQKLPSKSNPPIVTPYNPIPNTTPYSIASDPHLDIGVVEKGANEPNSNKKKINARGTGEKPISSTPINAASAPETNTSKSKANKQKQKKGTQPSPNTSSPTSVSVNEEKITSDVKKRPQNKRGKENKPTNSQEKKTCENRPAENDEPEVPTGFPTPDDEVLDGAEEGLDPKGPLRLQKCERFGRYLAAGRPLLAGERVLLEPAALLGPRADARAPTCLRCLRSLPRPPPLCELCCAAPLCSRCLHKDAPFGEAECMWLRARRGPPPDLCRPRVVLCVRALLMRRLNDDRWARVERLEAHEEARRNGEAWEETRIHVVEPLRAAGLLEADEDEALLQRISGILDVNTFEVRASGGPGTEAVVAAGPARALFPAAALLAHDCLPSAHVAVDEKHVVHVRTARPLKEGEPLTLCYAAPLQATAERREHLLEGKYFRCECSRCRDPEESGSRLGGVRCPRCRAGDLLPPRAGNGWWSCAGDGGAGCGHRAPPELARTTHARARDLVEEAAAAGDERRMEALLLTLRRSLPAMAAPCIALLQALMASYRSRLQSEPRPATALLQRQTALARELLSVAGTLAPGDPRLAAVARYELHGALAALAQRRHAPAHGTAPTGSAAAALAEGLQEAERELTAAAAALLLEPPASPEGRLGRAAVAQLRELREDILQAESMAAEDAKTRAEAERRRQLRRGGGMGAGGHRTASGGRGGTPQKQPPATNTMAPATDGSASEGGKKKRRRGGKHRKQTNDQQTVKQN